ncbi:unnamed protein product [Tilletia caries]|nr:unnamed protein product [Tilletia caries]
MDQFNDWQHHPAITYDPNGFIANLDPAYISAAEQVPTNTTNPTPNLPTSSQRCLQLLPEDIREAYKIAYEAVKRSIGQHQRPDWDLIWPRQLNSLDYAIDLQCPGPGPNISVLSYWPFRHPPNIQSHGFNTTLYHPPRPVKDSQRPARADPAELNGFHV